MNFLESDRRRQRSADAGAQREGRVAPRRERLGAEARPAPGEELPERLRRGARVAAAGARREAAEPQSLQLEAAFANVLLRKYRTKS